MQAGCLQLASQEFLNCKQMCPPAVWGEAGSACDDDAPGVLGVVVEHARVGVDGEVDVALLNFFHRL